MISEAMTAETDRAPADLMLSTLYEQVQEAIAAGRSVHFESTCEAGGRVSYYITVPPIPSVIPAQDHRQLAEEIVGALFGNGQGEQADFMILAVDESVTDRHLGTLGRSAAVDAVEKALRGQG